MGTFLPGSSGPQVVVRVAICCGLLLLSGGGGEQLFCHTHSLWSFCCWCCHCCAGMFDSLSSVASQPTGVWDIVPADLVASSILAAAAAVSAGAAAAISHATQAGVVKGLADERRVVLGYPHPLAAAPATAATASHALLRSASGSQNDVTANS